jgi:hypothetical protein
MALDSQMARMRERERGTQNKSGHFVIFEIFNFSFFQFNDIHKEMVE